MPKLELLFVSRAAVVPDLLPRNDDCTDTAHLLLCRRVLRREEPGTATEPVHQPYEDTLGIMPGLWPGQFNFLQANTSAADEVGHGRTDACGIAAHHAEALATLCWRLVMSDTRGARCPCASVLRCRGCCGSEPAWRSRPSTARESSSSSVMVFASSFCTDAHRALLAYCNHI